jgi:hypothetical protein
VVSSERWTIHDPPNTAVFTTSSVIEGRQHIARIVRDDQGDWQAVPPGSREGDESALIALSVLVGMSEANREAVEELDRRGWGSQAVWTATGWSFMPVSA